MLSSFEKQLVQDNINSSPPVNLFWKNMVNSDKKAAAKIESSKDMTGLGKINDITDDVTVVSDSTLNESSAGKDA